MAEDNPHKIMHIVCPHCGEDSFFCAIEETDDEQHMLITCAKCLLVDHVIRQTAFKHLVKIYSRQVDIGEFVQDKGTIQ
jgi:transcription elongation factor Elf1